MSLSNLLTNHHKAWQNLRVNQITVDKLEVIDTTGTGTQKFTVPILDSLPSPENGSVISLKTGPTTYELYYSDGTSWFKVSNQSGGGTGDVVGPASSVDNGVPTYDGVTGKLLKQVSGLTISNNASVTEVNAGGNELVLDTGDEFSHIVLKAENSDPKMTITNIVTTNHQVVGFTEGASVSSGFNITAPEPPTNVNHLTNKGFVDDKVGGLYTMVGDSVAITGTAEQSILTGPSIGILTAPANSFLAGQSYSFVIAGDFGSRNGDTITLRLKNGVTILSSMTVPLTGSSGEHFEIEVDWSIRTVGVAGVASFVTNWDFTYSDSGLSQFRGDRNVTVNNTTFDTTIINNLDVTAQFSSVNVSNNLQTRLAFLKKMVDFS